MKSTAGSLLILITVLLLGTPNIAVSADEPVNFARLLQEKSSSIVTVKMVLQVSMDFSGFRQGGRGGDGGGREIEQTLDLAGVVVDRCGLVVVANPAGGGGDGMFNRDSVTVNISDAKVLFAGDDDEYGARVVVTDSNLNLTFLKIEELGGRKIEALDFSHLAKVTIGQELIGVSRHAEGFDFAPYIDMLRVTGKIAQPRPCWSVSGDFREQGLPLFDHNGALAGLLTTQRGATEVAAESGGGGGGGRRGRGMSFMNNRGRRSSGLFLVPTGALLSTLAKVLEMVGEKDEESGTEQSEKIKDGDRE